MPHLHDLAAADADLPAPRLRNVMPPFDPETQFQGAFGAATCVLRPGGDGYRDEADQSDHENQRSAGAAGSVSAVRTAIALRTSLSDHADGALAELVKTRQAPGGGV